MKLSQIVPKPIKTTIPIFYRDDNGELQNDSIKIYTPTEDAVKKFSEESSGVQDNSELLLILIKHFTDLEVDIDSLETFTIYFDDIWNILQDEMFNILSVVIKDGLESRKKIMAMNDEAIKFLERNHSEDLAKELMTAKKEYQLEEELAKLKQKKEDLKVGV